MPEINGKHIILPNRNQRQILEGKGPRAKKTTDVYLEYAGSKIYLMFDSGLRLSAPRGIEITKESIQELSDSIWLVKEFLEGKCKIEDVFTNLNKTDEQYIKDNYNAVPVEVEKEYDTWDYDKKENVKRKYKQIIYKTPEAG